MDWKCPACAEQIRHGTFEPMPKKGVVYRCPVCRLELVLDQENQNLTLAPLSDRTSFKATALTDLSSVAGPLSSSVLCQSTAVLEWSCC
jgi:hypothetical protein